MSIISGALMCKDEIHSIEKTLRTFLPVLNMLVVLDTGSTDGTQQKILQLCEEYKVELQLKEIVPEQPFSFADNRNKLIDECQKYPSDYMLFIDANDELRNGELLRKYCDNHLTDLDEVWMFDMQLNQETSYAVIRMIRTGKKWHYRGHVHEILMHDDNKISPSIKIVGPSYYQDRHADNYKTFQRNFSDKEILTKEIQNNPKDTRSYFFLARTCVSLANQEFSTKYFGEANKDQIHKHITRNMRDAYKYFQKRVSLAGDHSEEIFSSLMFCGITAAHLQLPWDLIQSYYYKAYELIPRAEPLYAIAKYYLLQNNFSRAYLYIRTAIELPYPDRSGLFIDFMGYNRDRYLLMTSVAFPMFAKLMCTSNDIKGLIQYLYTGRDCAHRGLPKLSETEIPLLMKDIDQYDKVINALEDNLKKQSNVNI